MNLTIGDNKHIHYRLIDGNSKLPYLVFLHEGLGCDDMWNGFPDRLCTQSGCPGLVYDRVGFGQSSDTSKTRSIHYLHECALEELPFLLEKVIPNSPFILVGHSDGASISLIFGAGNSMNLKGIISLAAHVFVEDVTLLGIEEAKQAWNKGKLKGLFKFHGEKTTEVFRRWADTWLQPWFKYWSIEYLLPSIEAPILAVQGEKDQYGTVGQISSIRNKSSNTVTVELVADCGHIPHQEAEPIVTKMILSFIHSVIGCMQKNSKEKIDGK